MLLSRSGVNLLSIITTSAVLTAVIGLALQDTLGNLLSGVAHAARVVDRHRRLDPPRRAAHRPRARDPLALDDDPHQERRHRHHPQRPVLQGRHHHLQQGRPGEPALGLLQRAPAPSAQPGAARSCARRSSARPTSRRATPPDCITWRYHESWLEYAVRYRLVDYLPDDPTDSEVRKRIWYALHRENIEMPYPGYNVFMTEMSAARAATQGRSRARAAPRAVAARSASWRRSTTARGWPSPMGCTTRSTASAR